MAHTPFVRIVPGADTAVIFIHGILGTPDHFLPFLPLIPEGVSVANLLLDGHGEGVREFSHTSMAKWEAQVHSTVDSFLATHQKVYLAAHSLGTLLAIEQAVKKPIAGLFLLAVPIRLGIKPRVFSTCWKVYRGNIKNTDLYAIAAQNCCGIRQHKNPLLYLGWIPRFWELFVKIRKTKKLLPDLAAPAAAYQSANDELVASASTRVLEALSSLRVCVLEGSSHYYYKPEDLAFLQEEFSRFLR